MTSPKRHSALPPSLPPRGLARVEAAAYIGVSVTMFDAMVLDGRMPGPVEINRRRVWDRLAVDKAFDALTNKHRVNPFDRVFDDDAAA